MLWLYSYVHLPPVPTPHFLLSSRGRTFVEIATPIFMVTTYLFVFIPSPEAVPLLSTSIIFAIPLHPLSLMIAWQMHTSYPLSFLFKTERYFTLCMYSRVTKVLQHHMMLRLFHPFLSTCLLRTIFPKPRSHSLFRWPRHLPFHCHTSLRYHLPTWLPFILISDSDSLRLPLYLRYPVRYFDSLWQALPRPILVFNLS